MAVRANESCTQRHGQAGRCLDSLAYLEEAGGGEIEYRYRQEGEMFGVLSSGKKGDHSE